MRYSPYNTMDLMMNFHESKVTATSFGRELSSYGVAAHLAEMRRGDARGTIFDENCISQWKIPQLASLNNGKSDIQSHRSAQALSTAGLGGPL